MARKGDNLMSLKAERIFTLFLFLLFAFLFVVTWRYPYRARLVPLVLLVPALILTGVQLALSLRKTELPESQREQEGEEGFELDAPFDQEIRVLGGFVLLAVGVWLFGFLISAPVFLLLFLRGWGKESWLLSITLSGLATLAIYFIVEVGFRIILYRGLLFS
jgi:hypothetical protein